MNKKRQDIKNLIKHTANNIESIHTQPCGQVEVITRSGKEVTLNDLQIIADCYFGGIKHLDIYTESIKNNRLKFTLDNPYLVVC